MEHPEQPNEPKWHEFVEADIRGLNTGFYKAQPFTYLRQRLFAMTVLATSPEDVRNALGKGISIGELLIKSDGTGDAGDLSAVLESENRDSFVITESQELSHHVGETLTRMYLAHEGLPACPPWELAKVWRPGEFKRRLTKRFVIQERGASLEPVSQVFFGTRNVDHLKLDPTPPEGRSPDPGNVEDFLRHFARLLLDEGAAYNAVKHGLGVTAGHASVQLGDGSVLKRSGQSIAYLERAKDEQGRWQWQQTTWWVDADYSIGLAWIGCQLLEQLWSFAQARYVGTPVKGIKLLDKPKYSELESSRFKTGITPLGMSRSLFLPTD